MYRHLIHTALASLLLTTPLAAQTDDPPLTEFCKDKKKKKKKPRVVSPPPAPAPAVHVDTYHDIFGPHEEPSVMWCEETILTLGRAMDSIAYLCNDPVTRLTLLQHIEGLVEGCLACCHTGQEDWKKCISPLARTWDRWKTQKANNVHPNAGNIAEFTKTDFTK